MSTQKPGIISRCRDALFGVYAWAVFGGCVLFGLLVALLVPGHDRRCRWIAGAVRNVFVLSGVPAEIHGLENLPDEDCVVVANHASYVDGLLLKGYLPARFSFVVKGEMRDIPIVHFLLRRAGSKFVERHETAGSTRDARTIVKAAQQGTSLAFFPEGTFEQKPGLGRFRAGAFVAATKGGMAIVPVAISGTRRMLPSERNLPRPVTVRADILSPIGTDDSAYGDHRELAQLARQRILEVLDEPDLLTVDLPGPVAGSGENA